VTGLHYDTWNCSIFALKSGERFTHACHSLMLITHRDRVFA
jgi:hypothetical protein